MARRPPIAAEAAAVTWALPPASRVGGGGAAWGLRGDARALAAVWATLLGCSGSAPPDTSAATGVLAADAAGEPAASRAEAPEPGGVALAVADAAHRPWTRPCPRPLPPDVLACVDGFAIDRVAFDRARAIAPAELDNRAVLAALIRAEVLAGAALANGGWGPWLAEFVRGALARRLLEQRFERAFGPDQVQQKDVELAFRNPAIRVRYEREAHYETSDAQFICCTGDWRACENSVKAQQCLERIYPQVEALAAELAADPPRTAVEFEARVLAARPRLSGVGFQHVRFYYDPARPYDQQGDYDKMLEVWTLAAVSVPVGQWTSPVRTPYGWHITRLDAIRPRSRRKPSDPEVRAEIAAGILDGVRERDVLAYLADLMRARKVQLLYDNLDLGP